MKPAEGRSRSRNRRHRTLLQRLSSSGVWAAVGRISGTAGRLVVLAVLARLLSTEEVGTYFTCFSATMLGSMLSMFGLKPAIIRTIRPAIEAGATAAIRRFILRVATIFVVVAGLVVSLLFVTVTKGGEAFVDGQLQAYLPWVLIWIAVAAASQLTGDIFRALECFRWGTFIGGESGGMLANPLVVVALLAAAPFVPLSLTAVLATHVAISGSLLLISLVGLWRTVSAPAETECHEATTRASFGWVVRESWPNLISHVLAHGIAHIGILILAGIVSREDVALFGAVRTLMVFVGAPLQLLNVALSPFVVELHSQGRIRELQSLLRVTATMAAIPSTIGLIVVLVFPRAVLELFRPEYAAAVNLLVVMAASNLVFVLCGSNTLTLRMTGNQMASMSNGLITGSAYLAVLPVIIGEYGVLGAAFAAATLLVVRNVASTLLVKRFVGVWPVPLFWPQRFFDELHHLRQHRGAQAFS